MGEITAVLVRTLREQTGAGMMDCKKALSEVGGDLEKAVDYLRTKGLAAGARKAGRSTHEGRIQAYVHLGGRIGVLVEVNCESDFVARTPDFEELCKDLCMQIAATNPTCVQREDFDAETLEREKAIFTKQAQESGKKEAILDKIVAGRVDKMFKEVTLLEQPFVKDPDLTVEGRVNLAIQKLGENISVRRFVRFQLGEDL